MSRAHSSRPWQFDLVFSMFFLLIAAHFSLMLARTGLYYLDIESYIGGGEKIPYQYRILMAPIFRAVLSLFNSFDITKILHHCPTYIASAEQLAYFVVNVVAYFIALSFFALIAKDAFGTKAGQFFACFLFIVITYLVFVLNPNQKLQFILPYDVPSLAFIQICTVLLLRRRWLALYVVFAIATVNRETTFLIILFTLARCWTGWEERRSGLKAAAVLVVVWLCVKAMLAHFVKSGGSDAEVSGMAAFKVAYNAVELLKPWQWPAIFPLMLPLASSIYLVLKRPTNQALQWIAPYLGGFAALFVVAQITETRAFGDLTGFAAMSVTYFLAERGLLSRSGRDPVLVG